MKKSKQDKSTDQGFSVVDENTEPEVDVDAIVKEANDYADGEVAKVKLQLDEANGKVSELSLAIDAVNALITSITAQTSDHEFDIENLRKFNENMAGGMGVVVENGQFSLEEAKKWQFERLSTTSIKVGVGTIVRNDTPVTSVATDLTGFSSAGTYYILATLVRNVAPVRNPRLIPDGVLVTKSAVNTWPSLDPAGTVIYVLGEVVVNSSSVISDFTQYISDDIHDWQDVPDGRRHVSTNPSARTLNRNPLATAHEMELEMYGAELTALKGTQAWASNHGLPMLLKDVEGTGDLEWYGLDSEHAARSIGLTAADLLELYTFASAGSTEITGTSSRASRDMVIRDRSVNPVQVIYGNLETFQAYRADLADGLIDYSVITHAHENHTFNTDDHDQDGTDRYIINNGTAGRNNMSGVIGSYDTKKSIDPNNRILYDNQGTGDPTYDQVASVNWVSRLLVDKLGATVLKWDLTTDNWLLKFNATNQWDKTTFLVDVTGAIEFLADTTINMTAGAESTWNIPGLTAIPLVDTGSTLALGTDAKRWNTVSIYSRYSSTLRSTNYVYLDAELGIKFDGHGTANLYLGESDSQVANIYYNGKTGLTARSEKVRIPTESGGYVEAYITNGGITVD